VPPATGETYRCPCGAHYIFIDYGDDDETVFDLRARWD
jgi:hypothetical protein